MIDIHAHILPGMDDGTGDAAEALQVARIAVDEGIHKIIATPHIAEGVYENTKEDIFYSIEAINNKLKQENIPLKILPGAEYLIEPGLSQKLRDDKLVTLNDGGHYILIELPFFSIPAYLEQVVFEIMLCGVIPVIAHPERNEELQKQPEILFRLADKGAAVQVNAGSIAGVFGERARDTAVNFLRKGYVHFLASDAHSPENRPPVINKFLQESYIEMSNEIFEVLTVTNPERLLQGKKLVQPGRLEINKSHSFFDKVLDIFRN